MINTTPIDVSDVSVDDLAAVLVEDTHTPLFNDLLGSRSIENLVAGWPVPDDSAGDPKSNSDVVGTDQSGCTEGQT